MIMGNNGFMVMHCHNKIWNKGMIIVKHDGMCAIHTISIHNIAVYIYTHTFLQCDVFFTSCISNTFVVSCMLKRVGMVVRHPSTSQDLVRTFVRQSIFSLAFWRRHSRAGRPMPSNGGGFRSTWRPSACGRPRMMWGTQPGDPKWQRKNIWKLWTFHYDFYFDILTVTFCWLHLQFKAFWLHFWWLYICKYTQTLDENAKNDIFLRFSWYLCDVPCPGTLWSPSPPSSLALPTPRDLSTAKIAAPVRWLLATCGQGQRQPLWFCGKIADFCHLLSHSNTSLIYHIIIIFICIHNTYINVYNIH